MRCPTCGAWSEVKETRLNEASTRRRRACANNHRFNTYEVLPSMLASTRDRQSATRKVKAAVERFKRNTLIVKALLSGSTVTEVAKVHGLTEARIRQVRQTFTDPTNPDTNGIKENPQ